MFAQSPKGSSKLTAATRAELTNVQELSSAVSLAYQGVTPIATCHWQWVGNILAGRGSPGYWERLGLSWGYRWHGGATLFGTARWPNVLRATTGIDVQIESFLSLNDALRAESDHLNGGADLVVEVDEYHLPGYTSRRHVVHAVLIVGQNDTSVRLVDSRLGQQVLEVGIEDYRRMRSDACEGRVEPHKLYAVACGAPRDPAPADLFRAVRSDLRHTIGPSREAARNYLQFSREAQQPLDVCRPAGERYQAAIFFEYLASELVPGASEFAERFESLSDRWYFIHMMSVHERALEEKNLVRTLQLFEQLISSDLEVTEAVFR